MKKVFSLLIFLLIIAVLFCGCSGADDATVTIGYFPNLTHAQAVIGSGDGSFSSKIGDGYAVDFAVFNAGPAELEAMLAGQVDIGFIGPVPAINGYVRSGGDIVIISGASCGGAVLVSAKGSQITSVAQLSGKRVAVPQLGNTQHLSLLKLLSDNGLAASSAGGTVEIYAIANSEIKTLMQRGEIDAALVPEPWGARLTAEIGAEILLDYNEIWLDGNYSVTVVAARKDFAEAHPDVIEAFLTALSELTERINADPAAARTTANERIFSLTGAKLDESVLAEAFDRIVFTTDPARESIDGFFDIAASEGFTEANADRNGLFFARTE